MVTVLTSAAFRGEALIRVEAFVSTWMPKGAALIRGRRLFAARHLLEKIRYFEEHVRMTASIHFKNISYDVNIGYFI